MPFINIFVSVCHISVRVCYVNGDFTYFIPLRFCVDRIFGSQHGTTDEDAGENNVTEVGMIAYLVAEDPEPGEKEFKMYQ